MSDGVLGAHGVLSLGVNLASNSSCDESAGAMISYCKVYPEPARGIELALPWSLHDGERTPPPSALLSPLPFTL